MSYTALARKWRPRRFDELTGQEHVLQALSNALATNRVHHAFLFTGTRGVGKTTIARILAKCLNCDTGMTPTPCGECASCREIDEGRFVDLIEVDAASRTKVDDTRELLDNVQYAPTRGRYKVYLIDEVHMLSAHSFNALLKTLEEPPPHVKFLLATTDPQKLPVTVLSRCLQFNLKRLSVGLITDRMKQILDAEGITFEAAAVRLVAQAADGSMRDGLSLLDQLLAFGGGEATEAAARGMLATVDRKQVVQIAQLLGAGEPGALLEYARSLDEWAPDYGDMLDALATLLVRIAMKQALPAFEGDELHPAELLAELGAQLAAEDVQLYYQTAILGRRDLAYAPDPRTGFEMTLLRMLAFKPGAAEPMPAGGSSAGGAGRVSPARSAPKGAAPIARSGGAPAALDDWGATLAQLDLGGAARQLASHCTFEEREGALVKLVLDPTQAMLRTPALVERLGQSLSRHLGDTVRVEISIADVAVETPARAVERAAENSLEQARRSLENDPTIKAFQDKFDATLRSDTVKPNH